MKVRLFYNLKVDDGQVMFTGIHEDTQNSFPNKLYQEIDLHRKGTRRNTLEILQEDQPRSDTRKSNRKTSRSKK